LDETRRFVRLLSARSAEVKVSPKGRMTIPSECRDFLAVKVPGTCVVVGSGVAIELWQPETWHDYLKQEIENFSPLFERLTT
jgi:DNA-binding transcriptional regulator/RsmH inhibitor MraZ